MWGRIVIFWLLLVGLCVAVSATSPVVDASQQTALQAAVNQQVSTANSFLSAELTKQMVAMKEDILLKVNENNDANFREFDNRIAAFTVDAKQKIIIGGIGAILVANALIGLMMMWVYRRYSYEHYQETVIKGLNAENVQLREQGTAVDQLLQRSWQEQPVPQYVSADVGQVMAGDLSAMNAWQGQAVYPGSWTPQMRSQYSDGNDPMARPETIPQQTAQYSDGNDPMAWPGNL